MSQDDDGHTDSSSGSEQDDDSLLQKMKKKEKEKGKGKEKENKKEKETGKGKGKGKELETANKTVVSLDDRYPNPFLSQFETDNKIPLDSLFSLFHDSLKHSRYLVKLSYNIGKKDLPVIRTADLLSTSGNVWKMPLGHKPENVQVKELLGSLDLFQLELYMADASLLCPFDFDDTVTLWMNGRTDFESAERVKESYRRLMFVIETLEAVFSKRCSHSFPLSLRLSLTPSLSLSLSLPSLLSLSPLHSHSALKEQDIRLRSGTPGTSPSLSLCLCLCLSVSLSLS
jgi:hypothetical protein